MSEYKIKIEITLEQFGNLAYCIGIMREHLRHDLSAKSAQLLDLLELIQKNAKCVLSENVMQISDITLTPNQIRPKDITSDNTTVIKIPEKAHTDIINFKSKSNQTGAFGVSPPISFIDQVKQKQIERDPKAEIVGGIAPAFIAPDENGTAAIEAKTLYLSCNEVAELLNVNRQTVIGWRSPNSAKILPFKYMEGKIRYKLSDVETFQKYHKTGARQKTGGRKKKDFRDE